MWNGMLGPNAIQDFARRLTFAGPQFIQAALETADGVQLVLERGGILDDQFRPAIDGQYRRTIGGLKPLEMGLGVALKVRQRADVLQSNHNMEFTVLKVLCNFELICLECKGEAYATLTSRCDRGFSHSLAEDEG